MPVSLKGVGLNFGISGSITNVTGAFQSRGHTFMKEKDTIKDGFGETVTKFYYDATEKANYTYFATGTSNSDAVVVVMPAIGDFVTITDTRYGQISGSNWLVDDVNTDNTNTSAIKVTLDLWRKSTITP